MAVQRVLLVSPTFIKNVSNISDNISGKLLEPAIFEAQNEGLRTVLGDSLVDRLEELVGIANLCMLTTVKIDNAGLEQVGDEHMDPLDITDSFRLSDYYQHKADYLCRQMQNFVLRNRDAYPELKDCDCRSIKANLFSSATTGLWLGGVRGREFGCRCCRRYRR